MSLPDLDWDDEERALLKSAELDAPSAGAQTRTLAALGVSGAALGAAVTASSAQAAAVSTGKGLAAGKGLVFGKLLAVLVIGGTVGGAALHYRAQFQVAKPAVHAGAPTKLATPVAPAAPSPAAEPASLPEPSELPAAPELAPEVTKVAPPPVRSEPDIALEIAALDRARRASESGNFSAALSELDQYERAFKRGRLRPEALLLRIQTLINQGDRAGAKALGTRFLARYPKSPLSPRIQKLIGATK